MTTPTARGKAVRQRSSLTSGIVGVGVCALILVAGLLDLHRGVDPLMPALAALGAAGFWVLLVRPNLRLGDSELLVSNPLRQWTIPFSAVEDVSSRWSLRIHTPDRAVDVWALTGDTGRPKLRAGSLLPGLGGARGAQDHPSGPAPTQARAVAGELLTIVEDYQRGHPDEVPAPVRATWVVLDLVLLIVPLVAVVVAVVS